MKDSISVDYGPLAAMNSGSALHSQALERGRVQASARASPAQDGRPLLPATGHAASCTPDHAADPVATLQVEVTSASGLLSAVKEASDWSPAASASLAHATTLGPHAYARVELFPSAPELQHSLPAIETSLQVQLSAE